MWQTTFLSVGPTCLLARRGPKGKVSGRALSPHHFATTFPEPQLNQSCAVLRRLQRSVQRPSPKLLQNPTRRSLEAAAPTLVKNGRYNHQRFVDPIKLPDHPHVQNVTTPYINVVCYGCIAIPTIKRTRSRRLREIRNVQIIQL